MLIPVLCACALLVGSLSAGSAQEPVRSALLIGWDGVQRQHLLELLGAGKLPHLKGLIDQGSFVDTQVTTGSTQTKSGWAEILTGYSAPYLEITSNRDYRPIPNGYTVFERLKAHFGRGNIAAFFVAGKRYNVGGRGPHEICDNCLGRDPVTHRSLIYWDKDHVRSSKENLVTRDGTAPQWVPRAGEPFFHTKEALDEFQVGLGPADNVGRRAIALLDRFRDRRFLGFVHFEDPDEQGHLQGENSAAYEEAIIAVDAWLGGIVKKLKEIGIYDSTAIFVTTDHGMDEGGFEHHTSPDTFLATNYKAPIRAGDRQDVTPTILASLGLGTTEIIPPLEGISLIDKDPTRAVPSFEHASVFDPLLFDFRTNAVAESGVPAEPTVLVNKPKAQNSAIRIAYFHGGRSVMIYRTHVFGFFARESVPVELYTKWLNEDSLFKIPQNYQQAEAMHRDRKHYGKIDGMEIIQRMLNGEFEGGTVGESSFLYYANKGAPIVAIAMLGHDVPGQGGKGIVFRNGVVIRSPEDLKGKTLVSRRAGPGDAIFLREFLESVGMGSEKSIRIIDDLDEDEVMRLLEEGKIDGGLYHLRTLSRIVESNRLAYLYRPMDWMNPELSHSLLVFRKDVVRERPELVQKVVTAYLKRIQYERGLPKDSRRGMRNKSLMMDATFEGMTIPEYDLPPLVRMDLLKEMQRLLVKYKHAEREVDLREYVDNKFVETAYTGMRIAQPF